MEFRETSDETIKSNRNKAASMVPSMRLSRFRAWIDTEWAEKIRSECEFGRYGLSSGVADSCNHILFGTARKPLQNPVIEQL